MSGTATAIIIYQLGIIVPTGGLKSGTIQYGATGPALDTETSALSAAARIVGSSLTLSVVPVALAVTAPRPVPIASGVAARAVETS